MISQMICGNLMFYLKRIQPLYIKSKFMSLRDSCYVVSNASAQVCMLYSRFAEHHSHLFGMGALLPLDVSKYKRQVQ